MKNWDLNGAAAKIEMATKSFRTTLTAVDQQWTDEARRNFQETHLASLEPNVKSMLEATVRLAEVFAAAERQCDSE